MSKELSTDDKRKQARRLRIAGLTFAEIAVQLDVSRQRAQQYCTLRNGETDVHTCESCGNISTTLHCCHNNPKKPDDYVLICPNCYSKGHRK